MHKAEVRLYAETDANGRALPGACPVSIVEAQQALTVHVVQCERIFDPMRTDFARCDLPHSKSNAPSILKPVASAVIIEQAFQRFVHA